MAELKETWEQIRSRLIRYVRNKVDANVAEDIVHDVLLRVLKHQDKLLKVDQPIAWIYAVAKNRITDYYRQRSTLEIENNIGYEQVLAVVSSNVDENVDEEFSRCLQPLLDRLEPKYSEALQLADFDEMKQADAAAQVGITLPAMKSRVQRARNKLKNEFLNCCTVELNRLGQVTDYQYKRDDNKDDCC